VVLPSYSEDPDAYATAVIDLVRENPVRELGILSPKAVRIRSAEELPAAIAEFGFPLVLQPLASWTSEARRRDVPIEVIDEAEAARETARLLSGRPAVLAQQWAPGRREGVTLFIVGGEVLANCGHVEHRTTPSLGGASVLRETIVTPPDV
jgi:predicted ATP-grasp superfamily ATP-dependent carboligase